MNEYNDQSTNKKTTFDVEESNLTFTIKDNRILESTNYCLFLHNNDNKIENQSVTVDYQENTSSHGWAKFDTIENSEKQDPEIDATTNSATDDDDWADFKSTENLTNQQYNDQMNEKSHINQYSLNSLSIEQIHELTATCFPFEHSTFSSNSYDSPSFQLPSFNSIDNQAKQLSCFQHSLSLWRVLSNISNDPLGIKYQWHKSNTEEFLHQAMGVHQQKSNKSTSRNSSATSHPNLQGLVSASSNDYKQNNPENMFSDVDLISTETNAHMDDEDLFQVDKTFDLDESYFSVTNLKPNKEEPITSYVNTQRINNTISRQNNATIKTMQIIPGSIASTSDETKRPVEYLSNYSSMNPKELLSLTNMTSRLF